MTDDTTPTQQSPANEPDKTNSQQSPEGAVHAEHSKKNTPDADKIIVPSAIEKLWFEPVDVAARDTSFVKNKKPFEDTIIARRKWGTKNQNWDYLLSGPDESLLWYSNTNVMQVAQTSKETWGKLVSPRGRTNVKLDLFKVNDETTMNEIFSLEFLIGDSRVDPLHSDKQAWPNLIASISRKPATVNPPKTESRARGSLRSSTIKKSDKSPLNGRDESSAVSGHFSGAISEIQMLEAILERAKRHYHWFPCGKDQYMFVGNDQSKKAAELDLKTSFEVLEAAYEHEIQPLNVSAERTLRLKEIELRFGGDIDLPCPNPEPTSEQKPQHTDDRSTEGYFLRPKIDPTTVFETLWYLKKQSAADLLKFSHTDRMAFVSSIVQKAPHTLHEHNWVLLLGLALGTEAVFEEMLKKCGIKVESRWYERSYWKLLLQLKSSLNHEGVPGLKGSDIHRTWEDLRRKIHENDVNLGTESKEEELKDDANQGLKEDDSDIEMRLELEAPISDSSSSHSVVATGDEKSSVEGAEMSADREDSGSEALGSMTESHKMQVED
ncbi:hypothetical protein G6011_11299 [Alternaria panax]|uniref:Uncharacterized protein n=1 Tax=Alternaria panax TaxID=48097 RepID=A0AAD4NT72_9PLEO|nr:hypothetical protein G6011_11299 [Alternaria panax]